MKVKNLLIGAVAVGGLLLAGCGADSTADGGSGGSGGSDGDKLKIGVSIPAGTHGWTAGIVSWAEEMKAKYPDIDMSVQMAKDGTEQTNQIETMLLTGLDGLVVLSFEPGPVTGAVKTAKNEGVYVVSVDRGLTEPIADVWVQGDNVTFGKMAAEYMGEKLGGSGKILVLEGMTNDVNTQRVEAFNEVMSSQYPGIQILASEPGDWNREKAYEVTQTLLLQYPEVDAIWSSDDDMSLGAEQALKEADRTNIWMLGGGGMNDIVEKIMEGDPMYPATVTYSPKMIADAIERCIADLQAGKTSGDTQEEVVIPVDVVTPDNADQFYYPESAY